MNNSVNTFLGWRINGAEEFSISLQLLYDVQISSSSLHTVSVLQFPIKFLNKYKSKTCTPNS